MEEGMYGRRAEYYDAIYAWKDYAREADAVHERLSSLGIADGGSVLDAACGTGAHLVHLARWYRVSGFDQSPSMLAIARKKAPAATLVQAELAQFAVDPVDAAVCLFSSIAYLESVERLRASAACFARAIRPGGVLLVEPFVTPDKFTAGAIHMHTFDGPDLKLCRMSRASRTGDVAEIDFDWLALARGAEPDRFHERHALWLMSSEVLLDAFHAAGFDASFDENGLMPNRGLLIGRRR
jgi:ubiquinone/menaquinone biosynthesis C-methylase UbiE